MQPFQNTALLRPLTIEELRLEDPEWVDDYTITFYISCWFHVDSVFAGIHVETDQNDDYINLYCIYDTRVQSVRLSMIYVNNSAIRLLNGSRQKKRIENSVFAWTIDATSAVRSIGISPCSAQHSGYSE